MTDLILTKLRAHKDFLDTVCAEIVASTGRDPRVIKRIAIGAMSDIARNMESEKPGIIESKGFEQKIKKPLLKRILESESVENAKEDSSKGLLKRDDELELARLWLEEKDYKAREKLIMAYKPLAVNMAQQAARVSNMALDDLVQEAYLALTKTLDKFKIEKGNGFGTFARHHIQGELNRFIMDMQGPMRIGTNQSDKRVWMRFRKERQAWESANAMTLNDEGRVQIAENIGVPLHVLVRMENRILGGDVSLDEPLSSDGEESESRGSFLVSKELSPESKLMEKIDSKRTSGILKAILSEMPERERTVIEARLLSSTRVEFRDLGEKLGVTKERVRQIEARALTRLREAFKSKNLSFDELILD